MIPRDPPRRPQLGFLYFPPLRIQGVSIAGEETSLQVPELDLGFDIGRCPRAILTSKYIALSHGHMDHAAGLSYYFSQRSFQGMGTGTVVCHPELEKPIHEVMNAWVGLEAQRTPYEVIALAPDSEIEIKNHIYLRAFEVNHTVPALGFVVVEKRGKLRPDLVGLPQEKIVELKKQGEQITEIHEIPLVCYTGDTAWGPHFDREDVLNARILITECTFLEPEHRKRASIGKHLHLDDIVALTERSKAEAIILTHLSRRTHISQVNRMLNSSIPERDRERVFVLMDSRNNRARYDAQVREAQEAGVPAPPEEVEA